MKLDDLVQIYLEEYLSLLESRHEIFAIRAQLADLLEHELNLEGCDYQDLSTDRLMYLLESKLNKLNQKK